MNFKPKIQQNFPKNSRKFSKFSPKIHKQNSKATFTKCQSQNSRFLCKGVNFLLNLNQKFKDFLKFQVFSKKFTKRPKTHKNPLNQLNILSSKFSKSFKLRLFM
ncbi:hypothetical protein [Campylobacter troglodytis]|uniref:hypothetical protein n=1 Tax=Campylobacter troglodytis TaxID=654363 RepID=UPI00115A0652|nr:hypothetical protein [Campylobacter troglodytis]